MYKNEKIYKICRTDGWYCISCKYQQHVKQQEWRIRHLKKELKAASEEIYKLKAGNFSTDNKFSILATAL
jgi:hypothetical protein